MTAKLILVTTPDLPTAHHLAEGLLERNLVACVNLIPSVVSLYKWEGKLEQNVEVQMFLKTIERNVADIESYIHDHHPYDVPEFLVINIDHRSKGYLNWVQEMTSQGSK